LFVNLSELRTALQERREDYSQSDAKLNRKINQAYLDISSRRRWGWLRRECATSTYSAFFHANTGADNNTPSPNGIYVAGTENGKRVVGISQSGNTPATVMGKRVKIDNDFYRVVNVDSTGVKWTLDRPLRCSQTLPDGTTANHSIKIIYDEVALPVGTISVVNTSLFRGGSSSYGTPLSMAAVSPSELAYLDMDVEGRPTRFATTRKEMIPPPQTAPAGFTVGNGAGLAVGTYNYWFTHVDKQTGAESALGPSVAITISDAAVAQVSIPSTTARRDFHVRVYRSRVNGTAPYLLFDPASTTVVLTDAMTDDYLGPAGPNSASSLFMQLYPIPDDEYEVRSIIQIECTPLSEDNDRPLFDAEFHHIILSGAEALMLEAADEQGRANQARQRYEMGIARMIQLDRTNLQNTVLFGGSNRIRGRLTSQYASGSSEADFKA
jgi:hypothetical protein